MVDDEGFYGFETEAVARNSLASLLWRAIGAIGAASDGARATQILSIVSSSLGRRCAPVVNKSLDGVCSSKG